MSDASTQRTARWRLRLLGGFALDDGNKANVERLPSRAITLLLARLALAPGCAHGREELIELLWPGVALDVGRNRLRQALSVLRSVLEPRDAPASHVLLADRRTVSLVPGALSCDVGELRLALARGDRTAAARIYRGELLPGHFDDWVIELRRDLANLAEGLTLDVAAVAATGVESRPGPEPVGPPRLRLPSYLTRTFGLDEAAVSLQATVQAHRLVVLRGPGGVGKTRLAVEVARALAGGAAAAPGSGDGFELVAFVPLATCTTVDAMVDAVLLALRHEGGAVSPDTATHAAQRWDRVERALVGRGVLLVLDNFEQLVEHGRGELAHWLANLQDLRLLVTSRRSLGLDGEVEMALTSLPLPALESGLREQARNPAVELFVARARAARADFHLNERNHALVAATVRELHGLPLAIELAAARVRSLSLADLLAMLQGAARQAPGRAMTLLARAGPRGADDARHASMLRVVEWSWQLLSRSEQGLLSALSLFDGGATLQAAAAVAGLSPVEVAELLDELVASSVVYVGESRADATRYQPFEPVREYALMNLEAADATRLREAHLHWVCDWAAALGMAPGLEAFREELPNVLTALTEAARRGERDAAIRIVLDAAYALDDVNLPPSALPLLRSLLRNDLDPAIGARAHAIVASQSFEAGEREAAAQHAERALQLVGPADSERAGVLRSAARVLLRTRGANADVQPLLDEALQLARKRGQHDVEARTLSLLAVLALRREHGAERSLAFRREALALWQTHGPPARVTEGLVNLALGLGFGHAMQEKLDLLRQARQSAAARGQVRLLAFVLSVTGYVLADLGHWESSAKRYAECLQTAWDGGIWREWFYGMWNLPRTLAHMRRPQAAALIMAFGEAFYAERFGALEWSDRREARRTRRLVRVQLGTRHEALLWREGRAMNMAAAMRLAMREAVPRDPPTTPRHPPE